LPDNPRIRILAVTVAEEAPEARPIHPLYDTLERDKQAVAALVSKEYSARSSDRTAQGSSTRGTVVGRP
jgi:hypothetical protein